MLNFDPLIQYLEGHPWAQVVLLGFLTIGYIQHSQAMRDWPFASIVHIHEDGSETSFGKHQVSSRIRPDEKLSVGRQTYRVVYIEKGRNTGHLTVYITGKAEFVQAAPAAQ